MKNFSEFIVAAFIATINFCNNNFTVPLWPNGPTGEEYQEGLRRVEKPGAGSFLRFGKSSIVMFADLLNLFGKLAWVEVFPEGDAAKPGCRYFQAELWTVQNAGTGVDVWRAFTNIGLVGDYADREHLVVKQGAHGSYITLDDAVPAELMGPRPTNVLHAIVEDGMLSTWYPGPLTAPTPQNIEEINKADWAESWTVKY